MSRFTALIRKEDEIVVKFMDRHHDNAIITMIMLALTSLGSVVFAVGTFIFAMFYNVDMGGFLFVNLLLSQFVIHVLKVIIHRKRPYQKFDNLSPISPPRCVHSWPSGHTGAGLTIALVLSRFFPAYSGILIAVAILVGFSRIYLVNHYPSDVVAGALISCLAFILVSSFGL